MSKKTLHRTRSGLLFTVFIVGAAWIIGATSGAAEKTTPMTVRGVVAGTWFTPPAGTTASSTETSHYANATVCADLNNNAVCDPGEASSLTGVDGSFFLHSLGTGPIVVEASTSALNNGHALADRVVLRIPREEIEEGARNFGHAAHP